MFSMRIHQTATLAAALAIASLATAQPRTITADFENEGWPGSPGNGWAGAWTIAANSGTNTTREIKTTPPLNNGGKYLETTFTIYPGTAKTIRSGGITRQLDTAAIDLANGIFAISFDFRGSSPAGDLGPYRIFQTSASKAGTGKADTWSLYPKNDGYWYVSNGNGNGGASESKLIAYTAGTIYHFALNLDAAAKTYGITVSSSDGNTATLKNLGFRTADSTAGSWLNFTVADRSLADAPVAHVFAIDNLSIAQSPVPAPVQ